MHKRGKQASPYGGATIYIAVFAVFALCGWGVGWLTRGMVFTSSASEAGARELPGGGGAAGAGGSKSGAGTSRQIKLQDPSKKKWPGDSIHSVLTSSGDPYQNFQTRIMYGTYKLVQTMPGGERLTGFTRILHRTVPDILMDEVPTFHSFPHKPQCDGWCDYPVANRPYAIKHFFDEVAKNSSMIQGAWVFMLECDYVWMQPMKVPGSAYDPSVPGVQFYYDYIMPSHPNAAKEMRKLYPKGRVEDIPPSGPAPVLLRTDDWFVLAGDYLKASIQMEADEQMKKALEWVREMYAWDVAVAMHADKVKMRTEHPPNSTTIVQPPFDEALGDAALCHYTWGALYHEGLPSKGAKQVYRWEKRDYNDIKYVLKVPNIPMPPEYKDGWILEFDAPLNRRRHDLVVLMLTQMNKAINTLPDLTERNKVFQEDLKRYEKERDEKLAAIKRKEAAQAAAAALAASKQQAGTNGTAAAAASRRML